MFSDNNSRNLILTGIPRSGSTLALKLISHAKGYLCLDEPQWLKDINQQSQTMTSVAEGVTNYIGKVRSSIREGKPIEIVYGKESDQLTDNHFIRTKTGKILKNKDFRKKIVPKDYANKKIIVKSNVLFTACLPSLIEKKFKILVTIRNPVAIIKSWRSLNISVSIGKLGIAEKYNSDVHLIHQEPELLKRQILLLDWLFKQYLQNKDALHIIKYEQLVNNPGILNEIDENLHLSDLPQLTSRNDSHYYKHQEEKMIINALHKYGNFFSHFYPKLDAEKF